MKNILIAVNPSDKQLDASIIPLHAGKVTYTFGTTNKIAYRKGETTDKIAMPPVSAAIFKVE